MASMMPNRDKRPRFELALLQARAGDSQTQELEWLTVFRHFNPRLLSFFERRCHSIYPVDELLTDLWSRACLHIGSVRSADALWSWLTTIGNNLLTDFHRSDTRNRLATFTDAGIEIQQVELLIAGWVEDKGEGVDGLAGLGLSTEDLEFLSLYAVDGLSHDEIASRLGLVSAAASRQRLRRLRQRFSGPSRE